MPGTQAQTDSGLGVVVDFDPAVWLSGPIGMSTEAWVIDALDAVCADFGVGDPSPARDYLREVLTSFSEAELACDFRFLRLRAVTDTPIVAMLHVLNGQRSQEHEDMLTDYGEPATGGRWYGERPTMVILDQATGLRRSVRYAVAEGGGLVATMRHHRRVDELGAEVVLSCVGTDAREAALVLGDLDDLAAAVRLVGPDGVRR